MLASAMSVPFRIAAAVTSATVTFAADKILGPPSGMEEPLVGDRSLEGGELGDGADDAALEDAGNVSGREDGGGPGQALSGDVRLNHATTALASTIIGAGIMALPRAFATLGLVLGGSLLGLVYLLSYFSLSALVQCARESRHWTYSDITRWQFGRAGSAALETAIVVNNSGSMIIYLIIIGDVLCGVAPDYNGLVTNFLGVHDPSVFYASRPFVMAVMCAAGLAPLVSLRDLRRLAPMSFIAVAVAGAFVFSLVGLGGLAITTGQVSNFKWLPTKKMLGPTPGAIAIHLLAVLPVITMSFVCHYNLLPVARNLERFTERRIMMVIRRALSICTALFTAVAASGVVLFGSHTQDNILLNLSPEALARLLPATPAVMLCFAIRLGYCVCLMSTFAMLNWALRETLTKAAFGVEMLPGPGFYPLSFSILAVEYVVSILFPSVWTAMSLTGATAAVFLAYILPGALILRVDRHGWVNRILGAVCVVLGILMGVVGVLNTLVFSHA